MLEQLYETKPPCPMVEISPVSRLLVTSTTEISGNFARVTEYKDVNVEDSFKQFSITDFEIGNIIATGAVHLLKPVSFDNHDVDSVVNQVDNIAAGIDAAVQTPTE